MEEHNPKIEDGKVVDCPYWEHERQCSIAILICPTEGDEPVIPKDCPARDGILIRVIE